MYYGDIYFTYHIGYYVKYAVILNVIIIYNIYLRPEHMRVIQWIEQVHLSVFPT